MKLLVAVAVAAAAVTSQADLIMDQIGSNPGDTNGIGNAAQHFEDAYAAYSIASIDDFNVGGAGYNVTSIDAGMIMWNNANASWANVGDFTVDVYSSVAAGAANLNGDVYHAVVAHGSATINTGYYGINLTALITLPVNFTLGPGTYYIGVTPYNNFGTNGQTGVLQSTYAGGFPGGANAYQVNPGGGFGFGTSQQIAANMSYRIVGSPVPEPASMAALGLGALALIRRRRRS